MYSIPLIPHFYIEKNGVNRGIPIFLIFFFIQNIHCGLGEAALTCTHNVCFEQKYIKKKIEHFPMKFSVFFFFFFFLFFFFSEKISIYCMGKFS